jgi:type IV secretion system T-DNA border endonuclease VirD2
MRGNAADRQLARDIRRFVADMPVALTRRQMMVVELRHVPAQTPGLAMPQTALPSNGSNTNLPALPQKEQALPLSDPSLPRGRR